MPLKSGSHFIKHNHFQQPNDQFVPKILVTCAEKKVQQFECVIILPWWGFLIKSYRDKIKKKSNKKTKP